MSDDGTSVVEGQPVVIEGPILAHSIAEGQTVTAGASDCNILDVRESKCLNCATD